MALTQERKPSSQPEEKDSRTLLQEIADGIRNVVSAIAVQRAYKGQWRVLPTLRLTTANRSQKIANENFQRKKVRVRVLTPAANVDVNYGQDVRAGYGWRQTSADAPYQDEAPFVHQGEIWAVSDVNDTDIIIAEWI